MIAVDTNIVVRLLVNDNAAQAHRARALLATESVWLSATVLLETEWVLRSAYEYTAADIGAFLRAVLGLPRVSVTEPRLVADALRWFEGGLDFGDALHLAFAGEATAFATLDEKLSRRAGKLQSRPVMTI